MSCGYLLLLLWNQLFSHFPVQFLTKPEVVITFVVVLIPIEFQQLGGGFRVLPIPDPGDSMRGLIIFLQISIQHS
jgi:hypothetical protein